MYLTLFMTFVLMNSSWAMERSEPFTPLETPSARIRSDMEDMFGHSKICSKIILSKASQLAFFTLNHPIAFHFAEHAETHEHIDGAIVYNNISHKSTPGFGVVFFNRHSHKIYGCTYYTAREKADFMAWELEYEKLADPVTTPEGKRPKSFVREMAETSLVLGLTIEGIPSLEKVYTQVTPETNYASYKVSLMLGLKPQCRAGGDHLEFVNWISEPEEAVHNLYHHFREVSGEDFVHLVEEAKANCAEKHRHK